MTNTRYTDTDALMVLYHTQCGRPRWGQSRVHTCASLPTYSLPLLYRMSDSRRPDFGEPSAWESDPETWMPGMGYSYTTAAATATREHCGQSVQRLAQPGSVCRTRLVCCVWMRKRNTLLPTPPPLHFKRPGWYRTCFRGARETGRVSSFEIVRWCRAAACSSAFAAGCGGCGGGCGGGGCGGGGYLSAPTKGLRLSSLARNRQTVLSLALFIRFRRCGVLMLYLGRGG